MKAAGFSFRRNSVERSLNTKNDEAISLFKKESLSMLLWGVGGQNPNVNQFVDNFWQKYEEYADTYSSLRQYPKHEMLQIKIQKTMPTEGYHVWHSENAGLSHSNRILAWMIYLNDVKEGGETEFLYQSMRVTPKQGTLVIWPAGFTHLHRGNPPLNGEKYIMTGWLEYV
jgi:hypothetical protein